jgi:membrane-bound lytic murein transglycosylase D
MSVGEAARRVGMPEGDLRSVNAIPPRMLIKAGSVLIVPRKSTTQGDVASHVADNGQLSFAPEIATRRTVIKAGRKDSVAAIARRYRVSPAQVADWNNIGAGSLLKAGQQVVLHLPVRAARAPVRATAHAPVRAGVKSAAKPGKPGPRKPAIQQQKRR